MKDEFGRIHDFCRLVLHVLGERRGKNVTSECYFSPGPAGLATGATALNAGRDYR